MSAASTPGVHKLVLRELLVPRQWKPPEDRKFVLDAEQINELCETAERILREEPSVLRLTGAAPAVEVPGPRCDQRAIP